MNARTISSRVTREVRSAHFKILPQTPYITSTAPREQRSVDATLCPEGKVSIAYQGGGNWVAVAIDWRSKWSATTLIRVKRNGDIVIIDKGTNHERVYGRFDLGQNGLPENHTEIDLLHHYKELTLLLADEIAHHYHTKNPSLSAREVNLSLDS